MYMYNMKKKVLDMAVVALMMVVMMALAACGNDDGDDVSRAAVLWPVM